ncbi:class I SAM-dependent methyltransferase [Pseudonocardia kujensis]|uniref:class I SAM-dependent methyltransferase n=1 Tax=Pseudonocardia kujensis TaxID=1128675 RepID=UPI001E64A0C7|nr:methyltransferase domain-containing protein [Pseudonocardia kujensis]MCE0767318.1 class I SAM-dependent methyltransferase [Pseudonocardia kujensis]
MTGALRADAFDALLAGRTSRLVRDDGRALPLDPARWRAAADTDDAWLLDRCTGPTLDLGCGPGRLVTALTVRGVRALGVDSSVVARMLCRRRGAAMVHRDLFGQLPGEGAWVHVLLADGNIGIGGDPARLLGRAATLLAPGGTVLVEAGPDPFELWTGTVRTGGSGRRGAGGGVPWASVGAVALCALARAAGFSATACARTASGRVFVELTPMAG